MFLHVNSYLNYNTLNVLTFEDMYTAYIYTVFTQKFWDGGF